MRAVEPSSVVAPQVNSNASIIQLGNLRAPLVNRRSVQQCVACELCAHAHPHFRRPEASS